MHKTTLLTLSILGILSSMNATATHEELPELTVSAQRSGYENFIIHPENLNAPAADSAQLLTRVPVANVNRNGMVTGLARYRGMYGDRVNLVIDGTMIRSGGPNAMDPGLAYIPRAQLESLEVIRVIAPVSSGNETIGGTIKATSTNSQYGQSDEVEFHGRTNLRLHSVDVGDVNLDPEVSYQLELGLNWHASRYYFTPRAFYHHVNDYIQGDDSNNATANAFNTMANNMLGNNAKLLQFSNVDARLYGLDAGFGYQLNDTWHIDGTLSVIKGERRDNGDNLFRIAPVNAHRPDT